MGRRTCTPAQLAALRRGREKLARMKGRGRRTRRGTHRSYYF